MELLAVDIAVLKCLDYWPKMYQDGIVSRVVKSTGCEPNDVMASLAALTGIGWLAAEWNRDTFWWHRTDKIPADVKAQTKW